MTSWDLNIHPPPTCGRLQIRASANVGLENHDLELLALVGSLKSNYVFPSLRRHNGNQILEGDFNGFPHDLDHHHVPHDTLEFDPLVLVLSPMEIGICVQYPKGYSHTVKATVRKPVWRRGCGRVIT